MSSKGEKMNKYVDFDYSLLSLPLLMTTNSLLELLFQFQIYRRIFEFLPNAFAVLLLSVLLTCLVNGSPAFFTPKLLVNFTNNYKGIISNIELKVEETVKGSNKLT